MMNNYTHFLIHFWIASFINKSHIFKGSVLSNNIHSLQHFWTTKFFLVQSRIDILGLKAPCE
jgi:hypothetical protein